VASKGLAALAPNGLKSSGYTVSNYPRDNLTAGTRAILDGLAANPATANIGVNSGYRSPTKNAKAGGAKKSQHMKGNAIDLDISGLSAGQKKAALDTAIAAGAKGIGVYASGNSLHVDPRANPTVWGQLANAYKGLTKGQFSLLPDWARPSIDALFGGFNTKQNPALPENMAVPGVSREQALGQIAQQAAISQAFSDPTRALDVAPSAPSPAGLAAQYGQYRPGTVPASMPVGLSRPAPMSRAAPPRGAVYAGITAMDRALPSPASTMMASMASRPATAPTRPGPVTNAVRPSLSVGSLPAAPQQTTVATRPSTPAPTGLPAARAQTTVATRPATAALAAQYGQYRTPTAYTNVRNALQAVQPPAALPAAPVAPPAAITPPAAILAPALAPPRAIQDRPIAEMAPAAPRATATDVYNGLADSALDNTGLNTVGRIGNTTTVTNKYGVTTGMTPYGKQTAVGSLPSIPGISGPTATKIGGAIKGAIPGVAGSTIGGLLGGPVGALIGAALAKAVTQPGGILSNQNSFKTDYFGNIVTNKPQGGLGFPDAPSGGYGTGGRMGASFSNNSKSGMQGISPGASAAIGRGQGGLY
jgi:hypothetical protein